jgi:hypothetical protein
VKIVECGLPHRPLSFSQLFVHAHV